MISRKEANQLWSKVFGFKIGDKVRINSPSYSICDGKNGIIKELRQWYYVEIKDLGVHIFYEDELELLESNSGDKDAKKEKK